MFVLEPAEQAAAPAGNLRRVEREMLILGEAEIDRRELLEPGRAAVFAPAAADAGEPGGLIAHTDLPELDPGPKPRCEIAHQRPEIHPLLGREVDRELAAIPLPFGI